MKNVILVLALVLTAFLVMDFNSRMTELKRLEAEKAIILEQKNDRMSTVAALEAQIAYAASDMAVIKWAYENHMTRDGDFAVIPIQVVQETPVPTPKPQIIPTETSNFEKWLLLFLYR